MLWEAYCEFERNFKRNDRVLKLYKRMFETPLSGMNMALASFDVWSHENNVPEEEIAAVHDKFNTTYVVYEKAIIQREQIIASTKENNWIDYARMLEALNTNFLCVCSTYERGIKEWPSSTELWRHYITYAEKCTDDKSGCTNDFLLSVYRRSFRNCQDCGTIWAGYIRLLERLGDPSGSIPALVAQARTYITSAEGYADVAHAYIGVCRRLAKTDFGTGAEPSEGVSALRDACRYAVSSIKGNMTHKHITQAQITLLITVLLF